MEIFKKIYATFLIIAAIIIGVVFPTDIFAAYNEPGNMQVTFLDVGQGLSVLVESEGQVLLYDGGDREHSSYVVSYLKQHDITSIDYLIASHWDEDHIAGLVGCLNVFTVNNVIGPNYEHTSKIYQSFLSGTESQGLSVQYKKPGESFQVGCSTVTILSPVSITNDRNNNSVAIKIQNGINSYILTGDAEHQEEADIVSTGIDLGCDVLCLGHHGSASSSSWDFLEKTLPEYAVISCGEGNSYGHPHEETMEKMQSLEAKLFRTDKQGEIISVSNGTSISWNVQPTDDFSSGSGNDTDSSKNSSDDIYSTDSDISENLLTTYIINTSTRKFHIPSCSSVSQIIEKNKQEFISSKEELISKGYAPCKNCIG